jgi:AAA family ATP:ADP antiporter
MTLMIDPLDDFSDATTPKTWLDRVMGLAADVHAGEALTALLLALNGFLILTAYYVIRPVRAALLLPVRIDLPGGGVLTGPEITSYSGAVLAGLFLFIVPLYGMVASRVNRIRLINGVTLFFASNLLVFFVLGKSNAPAALLGVSFFLWIGIFNLMVIAQFWSFANDLYSPEQGKRLFAIVGFGASAGAIAGALITNSLISRLGEFSMMLISAGVLVVCLVLTNIVHFREKRKGASRLRSAAVEKPLGRAGGFALVLGQRYLLLIGLLTLAIQLVNTNGNYILNATLTDMAHRAVLAGTNAGLTERQIIGSYQAGVDFWQNVLVVFIQFFLVSRIFKYLGVGGALFVLPALALGSYGLFAAAPVLALIRAAKIAENATDYSLQNTLRRALFLPTSREAKYKALNAVETFFWRAGDMLSGIATFVLVQWLGFGVRSYAAVNIGIVAIWIALALALSREHRKMAAVTPEVVAA